MKKKLLFAAVIAIVASLSSCTKDYTCECTVLGFTSSETQNMKKKDAKEWCDEANTNAEVWGGSCSLQ